jgi:hypothetical protein
LHVPVSSWPRAALRARGGAPTVLPPSSRPLISSGLKVAIEMDLTRCPSLMLQHAREAEVTTRAGCTRRALIGAAGPATHCTPLQSVQTKMWNCGTT